MSGDGRRVVVLVGHGAPPTDFPRELVAKLKALESKRRREKTSMSEEERELDLRIRRHPRTADTDPYQVGLEKLRAALARAIPTARVVCAYNEFCAPSLEEAIENLANEGADVIEVVPSMLTPGGVHSEEEIPETLEASRARYPGISIRYRWPFDLDRVATILAEQVELG